MKNIRNKPVRKKPDLPETKDDQKHLQPDEADLELPEAKDIPGQEHVHVPNMNSFADTTASSADEEGVGVFGDAEEIISGEPNVTPEERQALVEAAQQTGNVKDDQNLKEALLDNTDEDGEPLNERVDVSGSDLDVPGSEDDDANEEVGEEDEENNSFSLDSEDEDNSVSKQ